MGQEVQKVNAALVEVYGTDEPELVASYVEDNHGLEALNFHHVGMRKIAAELAKRFPIDLVHGFIPVQQGWRGGAVAFGPLSEGGWLNDAHGVDPAEFREGAGVVLKLVVQIFGSDLDDSFV